MNTCMPPARGSVIALAIAVSTLTVSSLTSHAAPIEVSFDGPQLDRWMYPFNATPGFRAVTSTFGAFNEPQFDNRDGQMLIGFDTVAEIPAGLGPSSYQVTGARIVIQNSNDLVFQYDDTPDSYVSFLDPADPDYVEDRDPGQAIELFGVGYRNEFDVTTFMENTQFSTGDPLQKQSRSAYAMSYDMAGDSIDVSNDVEDRFDPLVWGVGIVDGLAPGSLVPVNQEFAFDILVTDPNIQAYFQAALDGGRLMLAVTSHTRVVQMGGDFPTFYNKEAPFVQDGFVSAAQLVLEVEIDDTPCASDLSGDGSVGFADLTMLLNAWGTCPVPPPACAADINGDGSVGFGDLTMLLADWGPCP